MSDLEMEAYILELKAERDQYKQALEVVLDLVLRTDTDIGRVGRVAARALDNTKE